MVSDLTRISARNQTSSVQEALVQSTAPFGIAAALREILLPDKRYAGCFDAQKPKPDPVWAFLGSFQSPPVENLSSQATAVNLNASPSGPVALEPALYAVPRAPARW